MGDILKGLGLGGARAGGGPVMGGQRYLVGERGPELFRPGMNGSITPNHMLGAGVNVVQNINLRVESSGNAAADAQVILATITPAMRRIAQGEILNQLRGGGVLNPG